MLFTDKVYSRVPQVVNDIKELGIKVYPKKQTFTLGNYDSYATSDVKEVWEVFSELIKNKEVRQIIVLDEGGRCIEHIPDFIVNHYSVVSIEQTRGGLYRREISDRPFPLIEVASSAVKKYYESPIIAKGILGINLSNKLKSLGYQDKYFQYGIVGNGAIGLLLAQHLPALGKIYSYDPKGSAYPKELNYKIITLNSTEAVIRNSDCIFFCTGKDSTKDIDAFSLIKNKIFISCSSEDREFKTLLKEISKQVSRVSLNPLSTGLQGLSCS